MNLNLTLTKINGLTEFIYKFFKPEAEKKGIRLVCRNGLTDEHAIVITDKEKVYSILTNLVKNAIQYTETGTVEFGYVIVDSFPVTEALHVTPLQATNKQIQFYIKDTGIGIPVERQHAISDRYVQADNSNTKALQGTGLGLSISKAYVEMLGGKIWVKSIAGIGSSFYFTLPYNAVEQGKIAFNQLVSPADNVKKVEKLKVLIVEDDETSEMLIRIALSVYSDEILEATTGTGGVEICRNNPGIQLILMDIKLPGIDGYEATRQIRQFNQDVVIIAQTAYGKDGDREKATRAGCNDYISKPLGILQLRGLMEKHFK